MAALVLSQAISFIAGGEEYVVPFVRKAALEFGRAFIGGFTVVFLGGLDALAGSLGDHDLDASYNVVTSLVVSAVFAGAVAVVRALQARQTSLEPSA